MLDKIMVSLTRLAAQSLNACFSPLKVSCWFFFLCVFLCLGCYLKIGDHCFFLKAAGSYNCTGHIAGVVKFIVAVKSVCDQGAIFFLALNRTQNRPNVHVSLSADHTCHCSDRLKVMLHYSV